MSWAPVTRHLALLPVLATVLAGSLAWSGSAQGHDPVPSTYTVDEQRHEIEVELSREGATLLITRKLSNPSLLHAKVELPIALPCSASLDRVEVQERDATGLLSWRRAELLDPNDAAGRWEAQLDGPELDSVKTVLDADTAVLMSYDSDSCEAQLSIYPVPPLHSRTVSYRVFIPSTYAEGSYGIELPAFDGYGHPATVELLELDDPAFELSVDDQPVASTAATLDGAVAHTFELAARDRGRGHVSAVDLDLPELLAHTPAALARLPGPLSAVPEAELGRVLMADFEAPSELAQLPPVRRVVVLIDASRSLDPEQRERLTEIASAYLAQLASDPAQPTRAELLVFDREPQRVYYDFVPAAWAAQDLPKLAIEGRNGSEVGAALDFARELLASPSEAEGADWVLVLSDLYLRHDFSIDEQLATAERGLERMHIVRADPDSHGDFGPGHADQPWTTVARAAGGMAWELGDYGSDIDDLARELIRPTRIWSLALSLSLADGTHEELPLDPWLAAGSPRQVVDFHHPGAALERVAFAGEVWGQRRAWTATPSDEAGRRAAARLAVDASDNPLSAASRTALAFHAQVVSPFTSAWALASFDGPAPAPLDGFASLALRGIGRGYGCGGSGGYGHASHTHRVSIWTMVQNVIDSCGARDGHLGFETTDLEIVAVDSGDTCVKTNLWALDLSETYTEGRKLLSVDYVDGKLTDFGSTSPTTNPDWP